MVIFHCLPDGERVGEGTYWAHTCVCLLFVGLFVCIVLHLWNGVHMGLHAHACLCVCVRERESNSVYLCVHVRHTCYMPFACNSSSSMPSSTTALSLTFSLLQDTITGHTRIHSSVEEV